MRESLLLKYITTLFRPEGGRRFQSHRKPHCGSVSWSVCVLTMASSRGLPVGLGPTSVGLALQPRVAEATPGLSPSQIHYLKVKKKALNNGRLWRRCFKITL